jgi:site-specific DNA recombinase
MIRRSGARTDRPGDDAITKVALYARYSSDNQSVASIEDQFRICRAREVEGRRQLSRRRHLRRQRDPPRSVTVAGRAARRFEIVLAEALDRVSRDQADVATLFKHLRFTVT